MASAMIEEAASPSKLELIREFLRLNGTQAAIDGGSYVQHLAMPGSKAFNGTSATVRQALDALNTAYAKRRHVWQEEYESHVNWEFAEDELHEIVTFLRRPSGRHLLEGRWRMDAYIATNTEVLIEDILAEARASFPT